MLLVPLLLLAGVLAFVAVRWYARRRKQRAGTAAPEEPREPGFVRALLPRLRRFTGLTQRLRLYGIRERYAHQIERAGLPFELSADEFLVIKAAAILVAAGAALLIHFMVYQSWAVVAAIVFLGVVFPDLYLSSAIRKQEHACLRALPGFLDLLALSVEAGMGFDAAVMKVTDMIEQGPLTWRFQAYLRGMNVGKTRNESLREMARKLDLPDFTAFASAVIQAAETGASMAPVLRTASIDMLSRRFERAEKMAHELPVKILLPLFVFVFPSTFLMILVPVYFQFMASGAAGAL